MHDYLNGEFYNRFSENEKARIAETRVITNNNPWRQNINGGEDTTDKIFLLSIEEVVEHLGDSSDGTSYSFGKNV